jgi:hypothetical protein
LARWQCGPAGQIILAWYRKLVARIRIVAEFVEAETGKGADALDRRPQLAAALATARSAKCAVLVSKLDRLSRDVAFVSRLMAQRVPFIVAELGPGRRSIHAAPLRRPRRKGTAADLGADKGGTGGKEGSGRQSRQSQEPGSGRLDWSGADAFATALLPIVQTLQAAGANTLEAITRGLNERGVRTARGARWHVSSVANLLFRTKSLAEAR